MDSSSIELFRRAVQLRDGHELWHGRCRGVNDALETERRKGNVNEARPALWVDAGDVQSSTALNHLSHQVLISFPDTCIRTYMTYLGRRLPYWTEDILWRCPDASRSVSSGGCIMQLARSQSPHFCR